MSLRAAAELSLGQPGQPGAIGTADGTAAHRAAPRGMAGEHHRAGSLPPVMKFRDALQGSLDVYGGLGGPLQSARTRQPSGRSKAPVPLPKLQCCTPRDTVDVLGMELGNAEPPTAWAGPVKPPPRDPAHGRPPRRRNQSQVGSARGPEGLAASGREVQKAYNTIDLDISQQLEARAQSLVQKHERIPLEEATGIYVVLERCHSCEVHHALTTRHNERQYADLANDMLDHIRTATRNVVLGVEEMLCKLDSAPRSLGCSYEYGCEIWHNASRVGAFEIYLLTPSPAPEVSEGVIRFPLDPCEQRPPASAQGGAGHRTWGAQLSLPGGYNATLLHSKLSSKSWPNEKQVVRRLFDSVPLGTVTVRVFSSSGLPLPSFSVEVQETAVAPGRKGVKGLVQFNGEGRNGIAQLEDVPLQTGLEIRISHATMETQVLKLTTARLRVNYTICTEIVFGLWTLDIPGGLAVYASTHGCHPSRIPDGARPFEGQVEMESGEKMAVKGGMHLPWHSFNPQSIQPASAFSELRKLEVQGYHVAELDKATKLYNMLSLHRQDRLEIAMLASPEVLLRVVFPECQRPLAGVQLQVESELQHATTNMQGECVMVLRPGKHTVRLMHNSLTGSWVEQQMTVASMSPKFQIPLPINVSVWRAPITVRGEVRACELWATVAGPPPGGEDSDWQPFEGLLQSTTGSQLEAVAGVVQLERHPVLPYGEQPRPIIARSPLTKVSLAPPFIQRIVETHSVEDGAAWQDWEPRLLGTLPGESPLVCGDSAVHPSALIVRSETCCCGLGVAGLRVIVDDGYAEDITGPEGTCVLPNLPPGDRSMTVSHASLPGGTLKYLAVRPAGSGGPLELPLMLDAQVYLYMVDEPAGRQAVYAAASSTSMPANAKPFAGKLLNAGRELKPSSSHRDGIRPYVLPVAGLPPGAPCPVSALRVEANSPGFQWCPIEPSPLLGGQCGVQRLAQEGPLMLGALKPFATVTHVNGNSLHLPVDEFPKVSDVVKHLVATFSLPEQLDGEDQDPVTLAANGQILQSDDDIVAGSMISVLAQLSVRVTFGHSQLGLPGVVVEMDGVVGTSAGKAMPEDSSRHHCITHVDGTCELFAPTGSRTIVMTHELLDGCLSFEVNLQELRSTLSVAARARIYASMVQPPADASPAAAHSVWLSTQIEQLPEGSLPVAGKIMLQRQYGAGNAKKSVSEMRLSKDSLEALELERASDSCIVGLAKGAPDIDPRWSEAPIAGAFLQCSFEDFLWCPDADEAMLADTSSWKRILQGPICIGYLKPPVSARCHGLDGPLATVTLPAETCSLVSDLCEALSKSSYKQNSDAAEVQPLQLLPFLEERLLSAYDRVPVRSVIDIWPQAKIHACVQTGCCFSGVPDVIVQVNEDHYMDGTPSSASLDHLTKRGMHVVDAKGCPAIITAVNTEDKESCWVEYEDGSSGEVACSELAVRDPRHFAKTGEDGRCCFVTNAGEHHMYLAHPLFEGRGDSCGSQLISKTQARVNMPQELHFLTDIAFHVYATLEQPTSSSSESHLQVWMCAQAKDIPADAESVRGTLAIPGLRQMKIEGLEAICLPAPLKKHEAGLRCPLRDLEFDIYPSETTVWCPNRPLSIEDMDSSAAKISCLHLMLLSEPIKVGLLRQAVLIRVDGPDSVLRLPVATFDTVGAIRSHLEGELSMQSEELGIFGEDSWRNLDDSTAVIPGQRLSVAQIASFTISVVVPDGVGADSGQAEPLPDVSIEIDGEFFGATDATGMLTLSARIGAREVRLIHTCFGEAGRVLKDVTLHAGKTNERVVLADIRVFFYATDPEMEEDEPADAEAEDAEPPGALPTLVWISACREQMPQSAMGINGVVQSSSIHGGTVSTAISSDAITECVLLSGALAEAGVDTECSTFAKALPADILSALTFDFTRQGFMWRAKDPMPLSERQEELGGCEYIRLQDCPVAVGYLDPVLQVYKDGEPTIELAVDRHRTIADVKVAINEQLDIPVDEMEVFAGDLSLADAAWTKPGMALKVMEIAEVSLQLVTGCCGDALPEAAVTVDGVAKGVSDAEGKCEFVTTVGTHVVALQHAACGQADISHEVIVRRGEGNNVQLPVNIPISVYVTDPEPEEEGEAAEEDEVPLYDPSCVWIASDPTHIPDDARPLQGCLTCSHESTIQLASEVEPVTFCFNHGKGRGRRNKCPMGLLQLNCQRSGFKWCPKDPSPLLERTEELDGCELLRLMACPMALGFMKPTVNVYCADSAHFVLPLETHGEVEVLQAFIAGELGASVEELSFTTCDFRVLEGPYIPAPLNILVARKGEALQKAHEVFQRMASNGDA